MKPTTIALFLLCTTIGSVQIIVAAHATKKPTYWHYDPENPQDFYVKLPKILDFAKQKNTEAIEQLRTKMRELWRTNTDHYCEAHLSLIAIYNTILTKKTEDIVPLMPLFLDENISLLQSLGLAVRWRSFTEVNNIGCALEHVTQVPKLIIPELIKNSNQNIERLWAYIPRVAQERMLHAAENCSNGIFTDEENTWKNRIDQEIITYLLPTIQQAHKEYPLLRAIITQNVQKQ